MEVDIKPIEYIEYKFDKVNIKHYDYESAIIYFNEILDNIRSIFVYLYIFLKKKIDSNTVFEKYYNKQINFNELEEIFGDNYRLYMEEYCNEFEKNKDIMITVNESLSKEQKIIKKRIKKIKENANTILDQIYNLKKNKDIIKKILILNDLIDITNNQIKIDEEQFSNGKNLHDTFRSILPKIFIINGEYNKDFDKFDIEKYQNILNNICYGLYDFLKLRKENHDFNIEMSEIILNKIKKIYENNDIIYLCIAPGNTHRIPKYLEKVMETKKVGIIYIQNSENKYRMIYDKLLGGFVPFWKNENYLLNKFKIYNDKIKDNLEVLIITYYFNSEYLLKEINKIINKKTLFYLGFRESGEIIFIKDNYITNIFEMFCINDNIVLIGPNGYNLPKQEFVNINRISNEAILRDQGNTLTFDDETNKKIQEFLLEEPIIPVVEVHEEHREGGFYNKYIKYKQKYLQLKLNKNLQ